MKLLERDVLVLTTIGRFRMLARPQVKRWMFHDVSEPVVTRFIQRTHASGHLGVERIGGNGRQILWLTRKGRDALAMAGVPAADLFPATGPAAAKDFEHTVAIGDAAIWLSLRTPPPDELLPAWALARFFSGKLAAIPDLLALWRGTGDETSPAAALAIEVDLGTEPVKSVLVPKLHELKSVLHGWLRNVPTAILVLVPNVARKDSIKRQLGDLVRDVAIEVSSDVAGVNPHVKSS